MAEKMMIQGMKAGDYRFPPEGLAFDVTELRDVKTRYAYFKLTAHTKRGLSLRLDVFSKDEPGERVFDMQTGVLPEITATIVIDLHWLSGETLFPEHMPGQQKITCHGRRVTREEISCMQIVMMERDEETEITVSDLMLSDEFPEIKLDFSEKLIDEMGQYTKNTWKGKLSNTEEMAEKLRKEAEEEGAYPNPDWTKYGGYRRMKLSEGSGFFSKKKKNGRWTLVDPEGYAFFSNGLDCTVIRSDCRVDGLKDWLTWLPEEDDPKYQELFLHEDRRSSGGIRKRDCTLFSFERANLMRAFGDAWYDSWKKMIGVQLKKCGINTIGNWSDPGLFGTVGIPYVTSLQRFPGTKKTIFRDFPDVLSDEYAKDAEECAKALLPRKDDPWMIGYFLRNEPAWAFVDGLVVADEVLYSSEKTVTKEVLIDEIREEYETVERLNAAWNLQLSSFDELYESREHVSRGSAEAAAFLHEFSCRLIRAYVEIPAKACRAADPNHMILGMRWAWISDPALVSGWENFDVFSINCYAFDPTAALDNIVSLGVDLPIVIGEYHFGAQDAGPLATGLKAVPTQKDRGKAIRAYIEKAAEHPYGVGCHYFQYSDQFALGRFDGENYNIGLFDICLQPYEDLIGEIQESAQQIYEIAAGNRLPEDIRVPQAKVIAY